MERRFAWQAATTVLVGATGFHLTMASDLWVRFSCPFHWWMHDADVGAHGWQF